MHQTKLLQKQQEILTIIPRFRFLDRTHIQSFLKHKQKQRINKWLKDLIQKEYLIRRYDNAIVGRNKRPAIFCLGNSGVQWINTFGIYGENFIRNLYRDKKRSDSFIEHCLTIASICCEFDSKKSDIQSYEYATESDISDPQNSYYFLSNSEISLDLVYSKKEKGKRIKQYILTYFDQTLPRYRLRNRIRKYKNFYFSSDWENNAGTKFPTILLLFETKERMIYAKRYTKQLFENEDIASDLSIKFATKRDAKIDGITGAIWETCF